MKVTVIPIVTFPCGCVIVAATRMVTYSPHSCEIHTAGQIVAP
jgi:hypothetical protein